MTIDRACLLIYGLRVGHDATNARPALTFRRLLRDDAVARACVHEYATLSNVLCLVALLSLISKQPHPTPLGQIVRHDSLGAGSLVWSLPIDLTLMFAVDKSASWSFRKWQSESKSSATSKSRFCCAWFATSIAFFTHRISFWTSLGTSWRLYDRQFSIRRLKHV